MKIILGIILFFATSLSPAFAAADDLVVIFEQTPLFNEASFLPGSEVSRWAKITNNISSTQSIIVEAINESDPDGLAGVFEIGIYEDGIQRYGTTTLAAFFLAGEVSLSNLAGGGAETQYDFLVRFVPGADNSYQEKSLGFDILVGFEGEQGSNGSENGGDGENGDGGGSGGGGGGSVPPGLTINGESLHATDVSETTATIEWDTSYLSTSRVVYGTTAGVFSFTNPPNYGYSSSTVESDTPANPNGVLHHTVYISGLTANTTYYFRTVSHASPDTVSFEHSFTTTGGGSTPVKISSENSFSESTQNTSHTSAPAQFASANSPQTDAMQTIEHEMEQGGNSIPQEIAEQQSSHSLFASLFATLPFGRKWALFLVLIGAIVLVFVIWLRYKRRA